MPEYEVWWVGRISSRRPVQARDAATAWEHAEADPGPPASAIAIPDGRTAYLGDWQHCGRPVPGEQPGWWWQEWTTEITVADPLHADDAEHALTLVEKLPEPETGAVALSDGAQAHYGGWSPLKPIPVHAPETA